MRKPLSLLFGLLAVLPATAAGPGIVFETSDGNTRVEKISGLGRVSFGSDGLEVTDPMGTDLGRYPYSTLRRVVFDASGSMTSVTDVRHDVMLSLKVTPSPATDVIAVSGCEADASFAIYASDGRRVASVTHYNGEPLDISPLTPGIYIITYNSSSVKFLKQ